jgi:transcriptional regulator with XRE-family HTH domain
MSPNISSAVSEKQQQCCLRLNGRIHTIAAMGKTTNRKFTPADRQAAKNLREIWDRKYRELGLTQASAAEKMEFQTQSAVSQYLNGAVPLRIAAALKFAKILKVKPTDIRPDLAELTSELSMDALDWAQRYDKLDQQGKMRFEAALLLSLPAISDDKLTHLKIPQPGPAATPAKKKRPVTAG